LLSQTVLLLFSKVIFKVHPAWTSPHAQLTIVAMAPVLVALATWPDPLILNQKLHPTAWGRADMAVLEDLRFLGRKRKRFESTGVLMGLWSFEIFEYIASHLWAIQALTNAHLAIFWATFDPHFALAAHIVTVLRQE
jgi:hypothetical protein